jgi:hypothetical protein
MENESLIVGNSNWAVKANSLLGYAVGEASGKYVPREFTFTRNSTATYTDENGIIQTAAANIARVQNNALLLEPQRTNLALRSEEFDNASWTKSASSITANSTISPSGLTDADSLIENTANSSHQVFQTITSVNGANAYTATIYIKQNTNRNAAIRVQDGAFTYGQAVVTYNLNTGALISQNVSGNGAILSTSATLVSGYYRIQLTFTINLSTSFRYDVLIVNGTSNSYTGDGTSGIVIYGAQIEAGAYPTTYIPTTSATATRVADFATTNNISTLFGSTEGSFFVDMTYDNGGASGSIPVFLRSSISSSYLYATYLQSQSGVIQLQVNNSGSASAAITSSAIFTQGQRVKIAVGYKQNDFVLYVNGSLIGTDTSGDISSSLAFIDLGTYSLVASTFQYNGTISESVLFPTRLTNAELQALTTL